MSGNLKRKALKLFNIGDEASKAFDQYKKSGESQQDFFTKGAIKALSLNVKKITKYSDKSVESVQIRLDETIHSMLKEKSKTLNITMERLIFMAINGEGE